MAIRAEIANLVTRLSIDAAEFSQGLSRAQKSLTNVGASLTRLGSDLTQTITLPLAAAGAATVKFGSDFESAFAGVKKTVEGTPEQLQDIRDGLRDMAKELPTSVEGLASIAEQAGQLGISTPKILEFTRVAADLGETTNLSANEAAIGLAKLRNILGFTEDEFSNVGSALVGLGNNFATFESDILAMSRNLAGAGKLIGLTTPQVLGFATALSSVGLEAEKGGSAISRVFSELETAIATGNDNLALFAAVANQTIPEFSELFRRDAAGAVSLFLDGLVKAKASGESMTVILEALGLGGIRVSDSLKRAALAGDLVSRALEQANKDFEENVALTAEATKRYETFESQVKIIGNRLKDAAIELFDAIRPILVDTVLPLIERFVDGVGMAAKAFGELPRPVQTAAIAILAAAAALGPILVLFGKVAFSIKNIVALGAELSGAWSALAPVVGYLGGALKVVGAVLTGPVGIIAGIVALEVAVVQLTGNGDKLNQIFVKIGEIFGQLWEIATVLFEKLSESVVVQSYLVNMADAARIVGIAFDAAFVALDLFVTKIVDDALWALDKLSIALNVTGAFLGITKASVDEVSGATASYGPVADRAGESSKKLGVESGTLNERLKELLANTNKTKTKVDELGKSFAAALNPLGPLVAEIGKLAERGKSAEQVALVYGERLLAAAKAEEEAARLAKVLGIDLPVTPMDAFAKKVLEAAQNLSRLQTVEELVAASNKRLAQSFKDGTATIDANLSATLKLGDGQSLLSDRTLGVFANLRKLREEFDADLVSLRELTEDGAYSAEEAFRLLGLTAEGMRDRARSLGVQFDETTETMLRHIEGVEASQRAAKQWQEVWKNAMGDIVSRFTKGISDMLFEGEKFSLDVKGIFKNLAKSLVEILVGQLFSPVLKIFENLGGILSGGLSGLFQGKGFGGFNFGTLFQGLTGGGLFGAGGGAAGAAGGLASFITAAASGGAPLTISGASAAGIGVGLGGGGPVTIGSAGGAASGGGLLSSIGGLLTNPWTIGIGGAIAAFFVLRKLLEKNPFESGVKEIVRDFAGLEASKQQIEQLTQSLGISKDVFEKFRKATLSSPLFVEQILIPAAQAQGKVEELIASFARFETAWGTFDLSAPLREAIESGNFEAFNRAWAELFANSDQYIAALGGSLERLFSANATATESSMDALRSFQGAAGDTAGKLEELIAGLEAVGRSDVAQGVREGTIALDELAKTLRAAADAGWLTAGLFDAAPDELRRLAGLADMANQGPEAPAPPPVPELPPGEEIPSDSPGARITINVSSRSEDLVRTVRTEVAPLLLDYLDTGQGGHRERLTRIVTNTQKAL